MSVIIKGIYECPKCHEPISSSQRPDFCPSCHYDFSEVEDLKHYRYPLTLTEQNAKLDDGRGSRLLYDAVIDMPIDKAKDMLNDAFFILQTISAKNTPVSDIRDLIKLGIRIGEVARTYENFLKASGKHVPDLYIKSSSSQEAENENSEKNRGREIPT